MYGTSQRHFVHRRFRGIAIIKNAREDGGWVKCVRPLVSRTFWERNTRYIQPVNESVTMHLACQGIGRPLGGEVRTQGKGGEGENEKEDFAKRWRVFFSQDRRKNAMSLGR